MWRKTICCLCVCVCVLSWYYLIHHSVKVKVAEVYQKFKVALFHACNIFYCLFKISQHIICLWQTFCILTSIWFYTAILNNLSLFFNQFNHSSVKHVTEWAPLCEQSATRCQTCGSGLVHSASDYSHGCCHIQSLVSGILDGYTGIWVFTH